MTRVSHRGHSTQYRAAHCLVLPEQALRRSQTSSIGTEKVSRYFGAGGIIGPGEQWLMRRVIADGGATVELLAEGFDISVELVEQIIAVE